MKLKSILLIIFLFILYFIFFSLSYSHSVSSDLEKELFRLHIIANSDSKEDQELKIYVRDKVVAYLNSFSFKSKKGLITYLSNHQDDLQAVIQSAISEKGFSYPSTIEIGNSLYPKKEYRNVMLPSGFYDGLKIKIGNASGQNWWCVLFPPMCLIDESTCKLPEESELILQKNLPAETSSVITSQTPAYKFKFKIIDFFNQF